jgi:hypothetical protein
MRRALPLALAAITVAGCGSSRPLGRAAAYVPRDAQAFISFRTDANWPLFAQTVLGTVPRVPPGEREAAFALVGGKVVAVSTRGTPPAHPLAADARYRAAVKAMPAGAVGIGYVRRDVVSKRLHSIPGLIGIVSGNASRRVRAPPTARSAIPSIAMTQFRWGAVWLTRDGIDARMRSAGLVAATQPVGAFEQLPLRYAPALFDEIPADARFVLDLPLQPASFEALPALPAPVAALFSDPSVVTASELDALLRGETAFYTRAGGEMTVVTQPADTDTAVKALAQLRISAMPSVRAQPLHVATIGGQLVVSTSASGIAAFRGGGPKLSARLHLPDRVLGVVYAANRYVGWGGIAGNDPTFTVRFVSDSR